MTSFWSDPFSIENFRHSAAKFADKVIRDMASAGIAYGQHYSKVDHICYRVGSLESYEFWKAKLSPFSKVLSEAMVNGRPITTLQLNEPIAVSESLAINLLELPAPKSSTHYNEGFEHIECVIQESLKEFQGRFSAIDFKTNNIDAILNADISCRFGDGVVKFHNQCLSEIIQFEKF